MGKHSAPVRHLINKSPKAATAGMLTLAALGTAFHYPPVPEPVVDLANNTATIPLPKPDQTPKNTTENYDPEKHDPNRNADGNGAEEYNSWVEAGQPGYIPEDPAGSKGVNGEDPAATPSTPAASHPLVALVNEARAAAGCGPLAADPALMNSAQAWAQHMADVQYGHSPLGDGIYAENIAMGFADAQSVHDAWMASPGHRANILNCDYTGIGIGEVDGMWVEQFGYATAPQPPAATPPATAHDWSGVAECESGGDWDINTGNGYSGGLQFSPTTWDLYGGQEFAPFAHLATPEEQQVVAERVLTGYNGVPGQGVGAWPTCGQYLRDNGYVAPPPAAPAGPDLSAPCDTHGVSFNENGILPDGVRLARAICAIFGSELSTIGGWRPPDGYNEHSSGHAIDVMISNLGLGDRINQWVLDHAAEYNLNYIIYKQMTWYPDGTRSGMADRGSATQNHYDHLHINTG